MLYGWQAVFNEAPTYSLKPSSEERASVIIAELTSTMTRLHRESSFMFRADQPASFSCNTQVTPRGDTNGNCIEIVTTTPLSCEFRRAACMLWEDHYTKVKDPERVYKFIRSRQQDSIEKNFLKFLRDDSSVLKLDGFQYMRKYEQTEYVMLIKTNLMTLPSAGLRFRDRMWITISPSQQNPAHTSVVRTYYQLYAEGLESYSMNVNAAHTRDFILNTLSGKVRQDHVLLQNVLIEEDRRLSNIISPTPVQGF